MREMTDEGINAKHRQVRGSDELKYPPNESRCRKTCGHRHMEYRDAKGKELLKEHQCFLAVGHDETYCQFSSECGERRVKRVRTAITLTVGDGAAPLNLSIV